MHKHKCPVCIPGGVEEAVGEQGYGGDAMLCIGAGILCGEDRGDIPCMPERLIRPAKLHATLVHEPLIAPLIALSSQHCCGCVMCRDSPKLAQA